MNNLSYFSNFGELQFLLFGGAKRKYAPWVPKTLHGSDGCFPTDRQPTLTNQSLKLYHYGFVFFFLLPQLKFNILFLFLQPQLLQIHLSPANLTTIIHYTLAFHKQISTNFNAFKTHWHESLQTLQNFNISHQNLKMRHLHWFPIKQRIEYKLCLLTYKTLTNQQPTYLYNSLSFSSHSVSTRSSDSLVLSIPYVRSSLGKRVFSVIGPRLWNSLPPDTRNSNSLPVFHSRLKTHLQNCIPSLGSSPSPWTVYPDFDSCYSHFMPYRPSVGHRAIKVHYYYY